MPSVKLHASSLHGVVTVELEDAYADLEELNSLGLGLVLQLLTKVEYKGVQVTVKDITPDN